jgi:SAM-dependent methyltransferase
MNHTNDPYGMEPSRPEDYAAARLDVVRSRWDQKAERWDEDLADKRFHLNIDGAYDRFLGTAEALVAERAEFCRKSLLVDLGCGTALVLARFIDCFSSGVGIDISPRMLEVAARRQLPRTRFVEGNCLELAHYVSGAGAVLSRGVLLSHYGRRWATVLLEQARQAVLPDGGFALLDFLNAAARDAYPANPANKAYFHADEMELLGRQAGFGRTRVLGGPERRVLLLLVEP